MKHIFLLLAITTTLLLFTTAILQDDTVIDVIGEPLQPGQSYYLVPSSFNANIGGITWATVPTSSPACPTFFITRAADALDFGQPIAVYPTKKKASTISLSSDVRIEFPNFPPNTVACRRGYSQVWGVIPFNSNYIAIVEGATTFSIEDDPKGNYNIKFCSGKARKKTCGLLGFVNDVYGGVALGYNVTANTPVSFVFEPSYWYSAHKKASSFASSI